MWLQKKNKSLLRFLTHLVLAIYSMLIQNIINSIDQGKNAVETFKDLTRAFDCVSQIN